MLCSFYQKYLLQLMCLNASFLYFQNKMRKHNYYEIIKALEPFGIYENNIGFMLYRTIVIFLEEQNSGVLWVVSEEGVLFKDVQRSHHDGHHHLPNWTRIIPSTP